MAAVGELVLVLGLLVSAHCEVRARDPEVVEEEEGEELGRRGEGGGGGGLPHTPGGTETPLVGATGNYPTARIGNWCSFVQKHVVKVTEISGTEKYVMKSQSPCPSRAPDCKLDMYKISTRPVYQQKERVLSALLWHCCPGHGGHNCEDSVSDPKLDSGRSEPESVEVQAEDVNINNEAETPPPHHPLFPISHHDSLSASLQDFLPRRKDISGTSRGVDAADSAPHGTASSSFLNSQSVLTVPHMMTLFMSKLEHLNQQVGELARDVAQLKRSWPPEGPPEGSLDGPQQDEGAQERLDSTLEKQIGEIQQQMDDQRAHMEDRLHSQHAMLLFNLTSLKVDMDVKLKRHQKMLQVSLQALNTTLAQLQSDQNRDAKDELEDPLPTRSPPLPQPFSDTTALWEAVTRLDSMVVNNTVKVGGLMEDLEVTSGGVQQLTRHLKHLEKLVNQTARTSQIQFMETGLEVEGSKVTVLRRVEELARNLTLHDQRLHELDVDVDYLYQVLYKRNASKDCDCAGLTAAVARLERGVANVTELANENRLTLDETSEGAGLWGGTSDWEVAVEALQNSLKQVRESLASEQTRIGALELNLTRTVAGLRQTDDHLKDEVNLLSATFNSLLEDARRHNDVLQLLLKEEVMEFLEWDLQDREVLSIPALREELRTLQEQLRGHRGGTDELQPADQPFSSSHHLPAWPPGGARRSDGGVSARERQLLLLHPEDRRHAGDGGDLWKLEKTVERLEKRLVLLEDRPCSCNNTPAGPEAGLQAEVKWLRRDLEEHLRVFKNVFSNAEGLVASDATLELDKLWKLMKRRERKRGGGGGGGGGGQRSRRDSTGVSAPSGQSAASLLLVARSPRSFSNGAVTFQPSLNRNRLYSDDGTFTAPVDGVYVFLLTWDLRTGPAHVVLRRGRREDGGGASLSLRREAGLSTAVGVLLLRAGEEVWLELKGGEWAESEDNVFAGLLLHQTT